MLQAFNLHQSYLDRTLFHNVSFAIGAGQKVGLVGPNGAGKTTLLRILAGLQEPEQGHVHLAGSCRVAYLPQHLDEAPGASIEGYLNEETRFGGILRRLGLGHLPLDRSVATLSGGEKTRLCLARIILLDAEVLLLDEPTNNLDAAGIEWLERFLLRLPAACVVVSHDRRLLDRATARTLELDPLRETVVDYGGNYSWYRERKAQEVSRQWHEYEVQQDRARHLLQAIRDTKQQAQSLENATVNDFQRGKARRIAAKATSRQTRLERMLSQEHRVEKPRDPGHVRLEIPGRSLYQTTMLEASDICVGSVLKDVSLRLQGSTRALLAGDNGSGKTTLLRVLLGLQEPSSGTVVRRPDLGVGYLPQQQEGLPDDQTVLEWFRGRVSLPEGDARTFLHRFLFAGSDAHKRIRQLSRGERSRLLLAGIMADGPDLLVLDEPTNHLDIPTVEHLEEALDGFRGAILAVSHDRAFVERLRPEVVWRLEDGHLTCG